MYGPVNIETWPSLTISTGAINCAKRYLRLMVYLPPRKTVVYAEKIDSTKGSVGVGEGFVKKKNTRTDIGPT